MLSRTAGSLFWLSRYVERAENMARLLDVAMRMSSLPLDAAEMADEWHSALAAAGCELRSVATEFAGNLLSTVG